jgi:catechol 2,3-dioxygenase-like lactoylglutathione lyase family enzyme
VVGALADAPARGAGEQLDGVPGDEAEHGRLGTACQDQAGGLTAVHLRDRRGGPRGRVDDLLVAGGWRLAGDQGPGDPVDRLPQHARSAQTRLAGGDGSIDQPRLDIPAGEVAGGAQPLEVAPPPLANGGAEGEAEPPGPEDEAELLRRQVAVGCCICVHVTSITCDVTGDEVAGSDRGRVEELLLGWGADRLAHPGGTLYEHLRRVASLLEAWSADPAVLMAGLCHACYGTDGYDQALLGVDDRAILVELIGRRAESLVYLYGSCDRASVYPRLAGSDPVPFRDRFTGRTVVPTEPDLRGFLEITAANELDVVAHNPAMAAEHGAGLLRLFTHSRERLSDAAWRACVQALGPHGPGRHDERAPIEVARLDHVVLTVTDQQRTVEFYRRVLGMQPVTFGQGRLALAFGSSKINLHQAGREFTPHAARPAPGSADICLVTTTPIDQVLAHLRSQRVAVEEGPVPRTGALGPMESVYIRDPDGNLIEIASYGAATAGP